MNQEEIRKKHTELRLKLEEARSQEAEAVMELKALTKRCKHPEAFRTTHMGESCNHCPDCGNCP